MHAWLLFLHIVAVLAFVLAHGIHASIMWRMRGESDPETCLSLFNGVPQTTMVRVLGLAVISTGLLAGFTSTWWQQWWMWLSLTLLVVIWVAMWRWGGSYFGAIEQTGTRALETRQAGGPEATVALEAFHRTRTGWQPAGMMIIGLGGLAMIAWLMVFKPF